MTGLDGPIGARRTRRSVSKKVAPQSAPSCGAVHSERVTSRSGILLVLLARHWSLREMETQGSAERVRQLASVVVGVVVGVLGSAVSMVKAGVVDVLRRSVAGSGVPIRCCALHLEAAQLGYGRC